MLIDSDQFTTFNLITHSPCNHGCCFCANILSPVYSFTLQKLKQPVKKWWCVVWLPGNRGNKGKGFCQRALYDVTNGCSHVLKDLSFPGRSLLTETHILIGNIARSASDTNTELSRPNLPTWCSICIDSSILILISLEALTCSGHAFWTSNLTFLICFRLNQPPSLLRYWTQW